MANSTTPQPLTRADVQVVETVAKAYRKLVLWFGAQLLLSFMLVPIAVTVGAMGGGANPQAEPSAALIAAILLVRLVLLGCLIAMAIYMYQTMAAMGNSAAWVYVVGMIIPCINILVLLMASAAATKWCRERGVAVGFLGPTPKAIADLHAAAAAQSPLPPKAAQLPGDYVRQLRAAGLTDEQIVTALVSSGWSQEDAQRLLAETPAAPPAD